MSLYIGLMSGTSMDGIDTALVDLPSHQLVHGITLPYSHDVKNKLNALLQEEQTSLASLCQLNTLIGREFANAVKELLLLSKISAKDIKVIGSHGQTVCHDTSLSIPYTLQLGCAHTIASLTQIDTVADFRTKDLINGGQGAPFAPLYHQELFKKENRPLAVVNIGGISNITLIRPKHNTVGWDVGPGNCLMDAWVQKHQGKSFDANGSWARQGKLNSSLLDSLLTDPFFTQKPPKSIGKEYFSLSWLQRHLKDNKPEEVQTTLLHLTAHCIANSLVDEKIEQIYLCGGGTHNGFLFEILKSLLPNIKVANTEAVGFCPDYLEAMMFAWLGAQTINKIPVDLTSITGSKKPAILGAVYFKSPYPQD